MLIILVASLASCDFDESKHHLSGGELLDDERISEIKNENERHYLEMVDAIEEIELISNTYVTVK